MQRWLAKLVDVRAGELRGLIWSFLYFTAIMTSWFGLRPLRETAGSALSTDQRSTLFIWTFVGTLVVTPSFAWLVSRRPRRQLVPWIYHACVICLLLFFAGYRAGLAQRTEGAAGLEQYLPPAALEWIPRWMLEHWLDVSFFVWSSIYNIFIVSLFWNVMVDIYDSEQGKRLFGFVSAGGSLGAIAGPSLCRVFTTAVDEQSQFLFSAGLLELCVLIVWLLPEPRSTAAAVDARRGTGGSAWAGFTLTLQKPYLLLLAAQTLLTTIGATFLYQAKLSVVGQAYPVRAQRTDAFAQIDTWTNGISIACQALLVGPLMSRLGLGVALGLLPLLSIAGFAGLAITSSATSALQPVLIAVVLFDVLRKVSHVAFERPAREVVFTAVTREEKYKAKDFLDLVVYRGGDALAGKINEGLLHFGPLVPAISGVPLSAAALVVAFALGSAHKRLSAARAAA